MDRGTYRMKKTMILAALMGLSSAGAGWTAGAPNDAEQQMERLGLEVARLSAMVEEQGRALERQRALLAEQQRHYTIQQQQLDAVMQRLVSPAAPLAGRATPPPDPGIERVSAAVVINAAFTATPPAPFTLAPAQAAGGDLSARVEQVESALGETRKNLEERLRAVGPFRFSGDFRYRHEPFFGGGPSDAPAPPHRYRNRLRLRVNLATQFDEEFSGGVMLASGVGGNPVSANQDLTGYFTEKPFSIDRAYLSYTPRWLKPLRITAGKWPFTFHRTQMMWDNDLNPEGVSEALSFSWKDSPLERLDLTAFQTSFLEVGNGPDGSLLGWQARTDWGLGPRMKLGTYLTFYDYANEDSIAANNNSGNGSYDIGLPTGFGGSYGFGASPLTNASGLINGVRTLASKFGILDAIARLEIDTGTARWPLSFELDFAQNTRACQNLGAFSKAGLAAPACNPRERQAYWLETILGRNQEMGDWAVGYTFARIERDALLSPFNFSNFRQGTNQASHRAEIVYSVNRNVTGTFRAIIGRQLGAVAGATSGSRVAERTLTRLQLDLIYRY